MPVSTLRTRPSLLHRIAAATCALLFAGMPIAEAVAKGGNNSNSGSGSGSSSNSGGGSGRGSSDRRKEKDTSTSSSSSSKNRSGTVKKNTSEDGNGSSSSRRTRTPPPKKDPPPKPPKERPAKPPKKDPPPKAKPPVVKPGLQTTPTPPKATPRLTIPPKGPPPQAQPRPGVIATPPLSLPPLPSFVTPPTLTTFVPPRISIDPPGSRLPPRVRNVPPRRLPTTVPPQGDVNRKRDQELLIAVDDSVSDGDTLTIGAGVTLAVEVQYRSALLGVKLVRLRIPDNRQLAQAIEQVVQAGLSDPRIIAVQPNYVFETTQTVAATVSPQSPIPQYSAEKVRLTAAHRVSLGRDIRVAVIDTGMDATHPELAGAVADSFDAIEEGKPEAEAHGTAIAGIVAAQQQIKGMAPDSRVLAIRAFSGKSGRKPEATTLSLIKGLDWAALNNARVVNMSFAGPKDALLQEAIEQAEARGMILVAAAGNGGPKAASAYPAAYERVIAVTASDSDDQLYDMANRGTYVAIAAPGVDILAPAPQAAYEMSSGTSLAAAHVSGIIALMLERKPTLNSEDIRAILARTARDPDHSAARRGLGAGIVDAAKAVGEAQ